MNVETVDQQYQLLEQESQQVAQTIANLAAKMQAAGESSVPQARDWLLDLRGIALQVQQEQLQVQALLQALHGLAVNTMQQASQASSMQVQAAPVSSLQAAPQGQGGGMLSRFMGGNFGQAMTSGLGMGAGFGLADSVINSIFG
ncbi:MAG: hypothetical protein ABR511_13695 [Acidimicrobiales bacterium]